MSVALTEKLRGLPSLTVCGPGTVSVTTSALMVTAVVLDGAAAPAASEPVHVMLNVWPSGVPAGGDMVHEAVAVPAPLAGVQVVYALPGAAAVPEMETD